MDKSSYKDLKELNYKREAVVDRDTSRPVENIFSEKKVKTSVS